MLKIFFLILLFCVSCKEDPKTAMPKLIDKLNSKVASERNEAALTIASYKEEAKEAVPALIHCLGDSNSGVRTSAAYALRLIDTSQAQKALDSYKK